MNVSLPDPLQNQDHSLADVTVKIIGGEFNVYMNVDQIMFLLFIATENVFAQHIIVDGINRIMNIF